MEVIDRDAVFEKLTAEYRYAKGDARTAYRKAIDIVLDAEEITHIPSQNKSIVCASWESCDHYAICNGTKEREICHCGGDTAKCDFYPGKRGT